MTFQGNFKFNYFSSEGLNSTRMDPISIGKVRAPCHMVTKFDGHPDPTCKGNHPLRSKECSAGLFKMDSFREQNAHLSK